MKGYRRGYRPPGAITRASCKRRMAALMPRQPKSRGGITKGMARRMMPRQTGITAKQCGEAAGRRLAKSGIRFGTAILPLPKTLNLDAYKNVMRGAGYAVRKEDLRRAQQR